jgi:tripartite-type tricarboxylate transporter receptor subunit TctC
LRGIGVTASRRASVLPEVPTLDELGLKGFELTQWQAVVAPAGTPKPIVDQLYREVAKALRMPDVVERLATQGGNELVGNTPEEFAQVIRNDLAKYAKLLKSAKLQVQ